MCPAVTDFHPSRITTPRFRIPGGGLWAGFSVAVAEEGSSCIFCSAMRSHIFIRLRSGAIRPRVCLIYLSFSDCLSALVHVDIVRLFLSSTRLYAAMISFIYIYYFSTTYIQKWVSINSCP
ncbi:hypothetical protein DFH06DRAFT_729510 [Mycena polygramma]|nr:hypothetical protein DFH06DRAFT_729510 [Mycena polygramma]